MRLGRNLKSKMEINKRKMMELQCNAPTVSSVSLLANY
jgi:hypothetical protein